MTLTLFTIAVGPTYTKYVPQWWDSVQLLNPAPSEIIIVTGATDQINAPGAKVIRLEEDFSTAYFRAGAENATSEWIAYCGVDDLMLPSAYRQLKYANNADIMVGTIILSNGRTWTGTWNPEALKRNNTLPAHSPFKKSLYNAVDGYPDIHWSDWGFWLKCAKHGAIAFHSTEPIAIFDIGENRETMSGISLPDEKRKAADNELRTFMETL